MCELDLCGFGDVNSAPRAKEQPLNWKPYLVVVFAYCAGLLVLMSLPFLGLYAPSEPFEDVYFPYFLISGPLVAFAGYSAGCSAGPLVSRYFSHEVASNLVIVVIPGFVDMLVGSVQWALVVALIRAGRFILHRRKGKKKGQRYISGDP